MRFYFLLGVSGCLCGMSMLADAQAPSSLPVAGAREDAVMSLNESKVTYHFTLLRDGGTIEITAKDPSDAATRDLVRRHADSILAMYGQGDFGLPALAQGKEATAVSEMKQRVSSLRFAKEDVATGSRILITASTPEVRSAVHAFLRLQIQEHRTADSEADPVPSQRRHPGNNLGHDAPPARP